MQPTDTVILNGYPRNLYYSGGNGDVPRLNDLRDALRKQMFDHKNYDSYLNPKDGRNYYNHNDAMNIHSNINTNTNFG